jgi:hypothetical protein
MLLCDNCLKINDDDDNIITLDEHVSICYNCYKYINKKLVPIIYDKNDNIIQLKTLQNDNNFILHANLLIHFSKNNIL